MCVALNYRDTVSDDVSFCSVTVGEECQRVLLRLVLENPSIKNNENKLDFQLEDMSESTPF